MEQSGGVATTFEEQRPRLTALASRMLGSKIDADDAVQEAWVRFSRSDTTSVDNLGAVAIGVTLSEWLLATASRSSSWLSASEEGANPTFRSTAASVFVSMSSSNSSAAAGLSSAM